MTSPETPVAKRLRPVISGTPVQSSKLAEILRVQILIINRWFQACSGVISDSVMLIISCICSWSGITRDMQHVG